MTAQPDPRAVFVVHGRDHRLRDALYAFLRAMDLKPLEFSTATVATGKAAPYVGEALDAAFATAQAVVVLFTPDDEARLRPEFAQPEDPAHERNLTPQARPNVLFEAGMAIARHPDRTILVEVGVLRPFSDLAGRHLIRLTNDSARRQEFAQRLQAAGCPADLSTTAWHTAGDFNLAVPVGRKSQDTEQAETAEEELSEEEVRVLRLLSQDREEDLKSLQVAQAMSCSDELAWYYLERLRDANYVTQAINMYTGPRWSLSKKGRAFLFAKGLLK